MRRLLVLPLLLFFACDTFSGPEATEPLSVDSLLAHLNFLADDSLYGRGSGSEYELEAAEYIRDAFDGYGLTPGVPGWLQDFTFETGASLAPQSQNVLGVLPGQGALNDQWVILGAHYDHVGFTQVTADSIVIYNGADDNASGTALMLEVARYLSHYFTQGVARSHDRRSVMFQAYGAEEVGLVGSTYFVQNPTVSMDSIVAMVNLDMVGRMRSEILIALSSATSLLWEPLLTERNENGLRIEFPLGVSGRSDHYPFYHANKPVIYLYTGTHDEYHRPEDDVWRVNTDGMVKIGDLVVAVLLDLVVRPEPPTFFQ